MLVNNINNVLTLSIYNIAQLIRNYEFYVYENFF